MNKILPYIPNINRHLVKSCYYKITSDKRNDVISVKQNTSLFCREKLGDFRYEITIKLILHIYLFGHSIRV